jgi:hypothetical protein
MASSYHKHTGISLRRAAGHDGLAWASMAWIGYGLSDVITSAGRFCDAQVTVLSMPRDLWVGIPKSRRTASPVNSAATSRHLEWVTSGPGALPGCWPGHDPNFDLRADHYGALNMQLLSNRRCVGGVDVPADGCRQDARG